LGVVHSEGKGTGEAPSGAVIEGKDDESPHILEGGHRGSRGIP